MLWSLASEDQALQNAVWGIPSFIKPIFHDTKLFASVKTHDARLSPDVPPLTMNINLPFRVARFAKQFISPHPCAFVQLASKSQQHRPSCLILWCILDAPKSKPHSKSSVCDANNIAQSRRLAIGYFVSKLLTFKYSNLSCKWHVGKSCSDYSSVSVAELINLG